jgi:hypothetical protein
LHCRAAQAAKVTPLARGAQPPETKLMSEKGPQATFSNGLDDSYRGRKVGRDERDADPAVRRGVIENAHNTNRHALLARTNRSSGLAESAAGVFQPIGKSGSMTAR